MKAKILLFFLILNGLFATAQVTSITSGNWNSTTTWDCNCIPVASASVTIASGHTVTSMLSTDLLLNQNITVNAGGNLVLQNGNTNLVSSFTINGTLRLEGGTLSGTTITFNNGSTYIHARDGGTIPSATWQPNATCLITGVTNTMPTGFAGQNFGNLTWDCSNQNTYCAFNDNFNIQETFRVQNSHNGSSPLGIAVSNSNTADYIVTTKDFIMDNPTPNRAAFYPYAGSSATQTGTLRVSGNVTMLNNTITGVLSGVGKSQIELVGNNDATFNQGTSFTFYGTPGAVWEVVVNKMPGRKVTFTSPIGIYWGPASGTPVSILNVQSGIAEIDDNKTLTTSVIQGNATLSLKSNSSLQLINNNTAFNNTFSGTLNATPNSTVMFDNNVAQNIFSPSGSFGNINITSNAFPRNLISDITLTGNFIDVAGNLVDNNYTATFAGTSLQNISGNVEFYNLNINNDVALTGSANVRFKGQLSIANDKYLSLGGGDLIAVFGASTVPSFNGGTNKYIVTNGTGVIKIRNESGSAISPSLLIPMGYSTPMQYAGISFPLNNLPDNQEVSLQVKAPGTSPYPSITSSSRVDAVWQVTLPTGTTPNVPVQVYYAGSTVGGFTGGTAYYHNGTTWVSEATSSSNASSTSFSPTSFTMATRYYAVFSVPSDYYTLANGAVWNVNSNLWSQDGTTPCNCSPNSVANANVRIRHNATIPTGSTVTSSTIIDIQNPVTLTSDIAFTAQQLNGVSGAKLLMNINALPTITTNNFASTNGTIVEFAGGAGNIPNQFSGVDYRNVIISGSGTKNLQNNTTIQGNLTIASGKLSPANYNLLVAGTTTINSGAEFEDDTNGGSNHFHSLINNGSFGASGGGVNNSEFYFLGDINNNGVFNINCNCVYNFNKATPPLIITPNTAMIFGSVGGGSGNFFSNTIIANGQSITFNVTTSSNLLIANNVLVINENSNGGVQINGNGTLQGQNVNSTWQQGLNAILGYASDQVPMSTGNLDANTNENIINYNRAGNQNIKATTYRTLQLTNSSIKSVPPATGNISILSPFTIPAGITFRIHDGDFTANSAMTINGTWEDALTGGTSTFNTLNIGTGATMTVTGTNASFFIFLGDIINQGTFNLQNSSQWRINANISVQNQSATQMNFAEPNSGTGQVNGNITILDFPGGGNIALYTNVGSPISGTGTITNQLGDNGNPSGRKLILESCQVPFTNTANAVVEYRASTDISTKNLTAVNNTFIYAQSISSILAATFHNVLFTNFSTYSLVGNITVNGYLVVDNTSTLNANSFNINIRRNWIKNGTFNAGTSRVIFDGNVLQEILGISNFYHLEISNPAHVILNDDNSANRLTLTQGRLQLGNSTFTLTATPATDQITQTFTNASTSYVETNGTGNLTRQNLLADTPYVFPIGDASTIRYLTVTLPSATAFVSAIFVPGVTPTPPPVNTDVAAGRWLLQGANGATVNFHNSGAMGFISKVHRLDGTNWTDADITTTFNAGTYTATPLDFSVGETYTIFGQNVNHIVVVSSFTQTPQPDGSILLSALTNYNLPTQFISTNTNVAQIVNGNRLIITYNNNDEFTDILAFNPGQNPIPPSDTVQVMRIYNWGYINQLSQDLDKKILLYPNPTNDEVFFTLLDNRLKVEKINLYNVWGQKLSMPISFDSGKISLQMLPAGVYVAEICLPEGVIRKKITKR